MIKALRDAAWLDPERARNYARILAAITLLGLVALAVASPGGVDPRGEPLGTDFSNFWSAWRLALAGHPASAYDMAAQYAVQQQTFGPQTGFYPFFYPPTYLLLAWPFAALPYLVALAVWIALTGFAFQAVVRRVGGGAIGLLPVLAYPAVMVSVGHGQNALLTTAILGAAALVLDRRPIIAGILLGVLAFKPHLAALAPLALLATGRWRALFAAVATAAALAALSLAAFGLDAWKAFIASAPMAKAVLDDKLMGVEKLQSAFGAVRVLGGGATLAYVVQAIFATGAILAMLHVARANRAPLVFGAVVATAAALTSPYFLDYDLALLAIPLAWACGEGLRRGFLPWEKTILLAAFVLPGVSRGLAGAAHLPLGPIVVALLFWSIVRRALAARRAESGSVALCAEASQPA